jgi:leader peptidase (prepilin peptidase)/N-methyltransferase
MVTMPLVVTGVIGLGATGWLVGMALRIDLNRFGYRIFGTRHDERDRPHPGSRWWVPLSLGLSWLALAAAFANELWPWMLLWLPFSAFGAWLAAVDLDVKRLPDKVQVWAAAHALVAGVGLILVGLADWRTAVAGLVGAALLFGGTHLVSHGGLGFGDVKYATICGWCLGLAGWGPILYGVLIACLLAIVWSVVSRSRVFAFGPWIGLGTVVTACLVGLDRSLDLPLILT